MANGSMSAELLELIVAVISENYNKRYAKFKILSYDHRIDLHTQALKMVYKVWDKFNPEKSDNLLAFYNSTIVGSFVGFLFKQRKLAQATNG